MSAITTLQSTLWLKLLLSDLTSANYFKSLPSQLPETQSTSTTAVPLVFNPGQAALLPTFATAASFNDTFLFYHPTMLKPIVYSLTIHLFVAPLPTTRNLYY